MALLATACGGGSSTSDESSASGEATEVANESPSGDDGGEITIDVVAFATPGDAFFGPVKNGVEQAQEDFGANVIWKELSGQYDVAQYVQNIKAAIATNPDGLAVELSDAAAITPVIEEAQKQGIPVVVFNEGMEEALELDLGILTAVGSNEFLAGEQAGERMSEAGLTNILCVNPVAGSIATEKRCEGLKAGFTGTTEDLVTDIGDPTSSQQRMSAALRSNPDIDGLITMWAEGSDLALTAVEELNSSVKVATFDLSPTALKNVGDGKVLFAIDQQPYLQGYLPVQILVQHHEFGVNPIGMVTTGPQFVTEENAQEVIELSKEGLR
jgi:simple sugar transport system substrate-binding protein